MVGYTDSCNIKLLAMILKMIHVQKQSYTVCYNRMLLLKSFETQ